MAACDSRVSPLCTREHRHYFIPPFDNATRVQRLIRLRARAVATSRMIILSHKQIPQYDGEWWRTSDVGRRRLPGGQQLSSLTAFNIAAALVAILRPPTTATRRAQLAVIREPWAFSCRTVRTGERRKRNAER
jgi:hypothetical protein